MHKFKELKIWMKAMDLVKDIYLVTAVFPDRERFNRAAVSIPSNIAEGAGRNSDKEFIHFLAIANGSSFELETQLILSNSLNYLDTEKLNQLLESISELQRMNYSLQTKFKV